MQHNELVIGTPSKIDSGNFVDNQQWQVLHHVLYSKFAIRPFARLIGRVCTTARPISRAIYALAYAVSLWKSHCLRLYKHIIGMIPVTDLGLSSSNTAQQRSGRPRSCCSRSTSSICSRGSWLHIIKIQVVQ